MGASVRLFCAASVLVLTVASAASDADRESLLRRFELFTNCAAVRLVVHEQMPSFDVQETVEALASSSLRDAGISEAMDGAAPVLLIQLDDYDGIAFTVSVTFRKRLYDAQTDTTWTAATWQSSGVGLTDRVNVQVIVLAVKSHLDLFVTDYLRVNGKACVESVSRQGTDL